MNREITTKIKIFSKQLFKFIGKKGVLITPRKINQKESYG